jgi:RNA polymerase sigma factor (sigma-70 family)
VISSSPSEPPADNDDERRAVSAALVVRAAGGDRRAAGEYFALHLPRLAAISRKVASSPDDAGDLLGDALLIVLSKWAAGNGPTENVTAYIAQIMRNRVLDEQRSPRSKVRHLEPTEDPPAYEDSRVRLIELGPQIALVRRAMAELPPDHQLVLRATVLEGYKPGDLEDRLSRPVSAIYSLSRRAKANLRRTMLRLMLQDGARAAAAKRLPELIGDSPETTSGGRSAPHFRTCRRCRRVWAAFGSLATLGVVPLVVVGDILGASPAAASSDDTDERSPRVASESMLGRPATGRALRRAGLVAGGGIVAAGCVIAALVVTAFLTQTWWFSQEPTASFDVSGRGVAASQAEFSIEFDIVDETWRTSELEFTLSEGVEHVQVPSGWRCDIAGAIVSCGTDAMDASGGIFRIQYLRKGGAPEYRIVLTAVTAGGATVVGTAEGTVLR